jgi:hypothetical protein
MNDATIERVPGSNFITIYNEDKRQVLVNLDTIQEVRCFQENPSLIIVYFTNKEIAVYQGTLVMFYAALGVRP